MNIKFTKMEGCGNDYVYINGFTEHVPSEDKEKFVQRVSDRHFGIGSDGVIFINPSKIADFEMEMWNADGTRAEMCGNGIRSVAKFVYDKRMTDSEELTIESFGKIKYITVYPENGVAKLIKVDMGEPILAAAQVPVTSSNEQVVDESIVVNEKEYKMTCVSMGNPHAVVFLDPDNLEIEKLGPYFENHERFPKRTNTEFVKILDKQNAGIYLELVEFSAYNLPNQALANGEIDLNSFQHIAYLNKEISAAGYDLSVIGDTLIAPLSLYSKKYDSLDALKKACAK